MQNLSWLYTSAGGGEQFRNTAQSLCVCHFSYKLQITVQASHHMKLLLSLYIFNLSLTIYYSYYFCAPLVGFIIIIIKVGNTDRLFKILDISLFFSNDKICHFML